MNRSHQVWSAVRGIAALAAAVLLLSLLPLAGAFAQEAGGPCDDVEPAPFADRELIPVAHRANLDCAYALGIFTGSEGADGQRYLLPAEDISRAQFAGTLYRMLAWALGGYDVAEDDFPAAQRPRFLDVPDGHTFDVQIHRLAAAGIIAGYADGSFGPNDPIQRDQTATLLLGAFEWLSGEELPAVGSGYFTDTATSFHRDNIDAAFELGLVRGLTAPPGGTYAPFAPTRRDQMGTVLVRAAEEVDEQFEPAEPTPEPEPEPEPEPDPETVTGVNVAPSSASVPIGQNHTVTATAVDGSTPFPGVNVRFSVTGTQLRDGTGTTDADGQTTFTFGASTEGTDTITACALPDGSLPSSCDAAGVVKDTGTVTWTVATAGAADDQPELVSVASSTLTATTAKVLFTFDEAVRSTAVTPNSFVLYGLNTDGERFTPTSAERHSTNTKLVEAIFDRAEYDLATRAAVEEGAVLNLDDYTNPPQSYALKARSFAAGRTDLPDLVSVTTPVVGGAGVRATFTFDVAVDPDAADPTKYWLILDTGAMIPGDDVITTGAAATAHVVEFLPSDAQWPDGTDVNPDPTTTAIIDDIRRGYVEADANHGPSQSVNVKSSGQTTGSPYLQSVSLEESTGKAVFTFDREVSPLGGDIDDNGFLMYYYDGSEVQSTAAERVASSGIGLRQIRATFGDGNVNEAVTGASVVAEAVQHTAGTATGPNAPGSFGFAQSYSSGKVLGPVLTSATIAVLSKDATEKRVRVTYGFDRGVEAAAPGPAGFAITFTDEDDTLPPDAACARTGSAGVQVRCEFTLTAGSGNLTRTIALASVAAGAVETADELARLDSVSMPSVERSIVLPKV